MKEKILSGILCLTLILSPVPARGAVVPATVEPAQPESALSAAAEESAASPQSAAVPAAAEVEHTSGVLPLLSKEQIKKLLYDNPVDYDQQVFLEKPSADGGIYTAGSLTPQVKQAALNRLNTLRQIAGLPEVLLDEGLNEMSQYGAVICAGMGTIDHYPDILPGMDPWFYRQAYKSTSSSNLAAGISCVEAVDLFMSDIGNDYTLGHRRWQLNPSMGKTGFGYAESSVKGPSGQIYGQYTAQYSMNEMAPVKMDYDFIGWPASGNFPVGKRYVGWDDPDDPLRNISFISNTIWSVTLNPEKYGPPDLYAVQVTLTRERDGHVWTMNFKNSGRDGSFFYVSTHNFGVPNCIMFRPAAEEKYEGRYTVRIDGLKNESGESLPTFRYSVDFFDPSDPSLGPGAPVERKAYSLSLTDCLALQGDTAIARLTTSPGYSAPEGKVTLTRYRNKIHMDYGLGIEPANLLGVVPAPGFTGTVNWNPELQELSWSGGDPNYTGSIALCYLENARDEAVFKLSGDLYCGGTKVDLYPCELHTIDTADIPALTMNQTRSSVSLLLKRISVLSEDAQRLLAIYDSTGRMTELHQIPAGWSCAESSRYITLPVKALPTGGSVSLFTVDPEHLNPLKPVISSQI